MAETEKIENYPGFPEGVSGYDLALSMSQQAARFGVEDMAEEVERIDLTAEPRVITTPYRTVRGQGRDRGDGRPPAQDGPAEQRRARRPPASATAPRATATSSEARRSSSLAVATRRPPTPSTFRAYARRSPSSIAVPSCAPRASTTTCSKALRTCVSNGTASWRRLTAYDGKLSGVRIRNVQTGEQKELSCAGHVRRHRHGAEHGVPGRRACRLTRAATSWRARAAPPPSPGVFAAGDVRAKVAAPGGHRGRRRRQRRRGRCGICGGAPIAPFVW